MVDSNCTGATPAALCLPPPPPPPPPPPLPSLCVCPCRCTFRGSSACPPRPHGPVRCPPRLPQPHLPQPHLPAQAGWLLETPGARNRGHRAAHRSLESARATPDTPVSHATLARKATSAIRAVITIHAIRTLATDMPLQARHLLEYAPATATSTSPAAPAISARRDISATQLAVSPMLLMASHQRISVCLVALSLLRFLSLLRSLTSLPTLHADLPMSLLTQANCGVCVCFVSDDDPCDPDPCNGNADSCDSSQGLTPGVDTCTCTLGFNGDTACGSCQTGYAKRASNSLCTCLYTRNTHKGQAHFQSLD